MRLGYAGIWAGPLLAADTEPLAAKLGFLERYGLSTTGIGLGEVEGMDEGRREALVRRLAERDLALTPHVSLDCFDPDRAAVRAAAEREIGRLRRFAAALRAPVAVFCAGPVHRFLREPPLPRQLDLLAEGLRPVAAACRDLGLALGIENHGDYYVRDLVELCGRVPGLGLFLDTGNTYLVGEAPLPAFEAAAPLTVGCHFKDHRVRPVPDARPLHFEVGPAVLGEGDVPLRECWRLLRDRAPAPDRLVIQIELIPPDFSGTAPVDAFERSLAFVRSLAAEAPMP
jgi:sugar phosphate isomerase/epimerase